MSDTESSDFLEQEKKKDPVERMVTLMEKTLAPKLGGVVSLDQLKPPKPSAIAFQVRKIENGFILMIQEHFGGSREIYIQDPAVLKEKAAGLVEAFAKEASQAYPPIHDADAFKDDSVGA